jgi:superfamily II DNA/RNA helicase
VKLVEYIKGQQARAAAGMRAAGGLPGAGGGVTQEAAGGSSGGGGSNGGGGSGGSSGGGCSGIVYCLSRKEAEGLAAALQEHGGIRAAHYHAGMTTKQRTEVRRRCV